MDYLDQKERSWNYNIAIKRKRTPITLKEIYDEYSAMCLRQKTNRMLGILDVLEVLLTHRTIDSETGEKKRIEWHHAGSTLYPDKEFFSKPNETKEKFMKRVMSILVEYDTEVRLGRRTIGQEYRKILADFEDKISKLFEQANKKNYTQKQFNQALKSIMEKYVDSTGDYIFMAVLVDKKNILKNKTLFNDFMKEKKIPANITTKQVVDAFGFSEGNKARLTIALDRSRLSLDKLGGKYAKHYQATYNEILAKGLNEQQIAEVLKLASYEKTQKHQNQIKTLARTFAHGINNLINFNNAERAGFTRFKYSGPIPERPFCKLHINKIYSIEQIEAMEKNGGNGQGIHIITYCGGYNCRHTWLPTGDAKK
jgi:hypothetical protein